MTPEEVIEQHLIPRGWREYPTHAGQRFDRVFYRYFESKYHCSWNEDKPGVQVQLSFWDFREHSGDVSFQIEVHGGLNQSSDRRGIRIVASAGDHNEWKTFDVIAGQLVMVWEEANRIVTIYILRASYICEHYTPSTLTPMEMKTWQQVIKHAGNADSGATHQDAVTGTHRVHRRRMN